MSFFTKTVFKKLIQSTVLASCLLVSNYAVASGYSASFQNADIHEFINTVSANLDQTIIIDPSVRGKVSVRSYETLSAEEYYRFFLSVLQVHGFTAVEQEGNILKVIQSKDAKIEAIPVIDEGGGPSDQVVTWVLPLNNVPVRELSPLLRQLNESHGNVVHYEPANVLLLTGRTGNIERLVDIVRRIDNAGEQLVEVIPLNYASAAEMERILKAIYQTGGERGSGGTVIVADERSNRILVSAQPPVMQRIKNLTLQMDAEQASSGNTRVFYLRYARAADLKAVLEGVAQTVLDESSSGSRNASQSHFSVNEHEQTNSLVITAQPDLMGTLENVIKQLDIRRAQVLVEAIIAEVAEGDGVHFSMQLAGGDGSMIQFNDGTAVPIGEIIYGLKQAEGEKGSVIIDEHGREIRNPDRQGDYSILANALSRLNGAAFSITSGDWTGLLQAVNSSSQSNVLATPSLMTLDNQEASFVVGDEVPTLTGSTSGSNNDNPYQTIERREVGVKLKVTPQINEGDAVRLDIEQEVSNINGQTSVDVTFATRQVHTSVMVGSGDTIVIGGLLDEDVQESESRVPILGSIPLLGRLFRSNSTSVRKRNLMVFIRPTIIRDDNAISAVSAAKYGLIRAEQLDRQQQGVQLMPKYESPVMEEFQPSSGNSSRELLEKARKVLDENSQLEVSETEDNADV